MKDTTLVIMAAGIGSRFGGGGVKQLTSFGPHGEIIMDYSIYDAIEAGFNKIVFVIRHSMEKDFREIIGDRIAKKIHVEYAFQELEDLPAGYTVPEGRTKPWGTGQAILSCREVVHEPFAVINADDYYGKDAFRKVHQFLVEAADHTFTDKEKADKDTENLPGCSVPKQACYQFCMAGFILKNTLSEHGGVTRGICRLNDEGVLSEILETKDIIKTKDGAAVYSANASLIPLNPESLVSMNFWGFTPDFMDELESGFLHFLDELDENALKAEYLLPTIADRLLKEKRADISVLPSTDKWFGVTFREDVPFVRQSILELIKAGLYPERLF
ncbi:MAG: nucleotidyltransferase [Lachnospiraceae bacterium]|nr:nucleotidyltransferase [Lachnospiraceae bacterium]MCD7765452.1 nucleotidyltransferase [Lachnospiraceae bacterium]